MPGNPWPGRALITLEELEEASGYSRRELYSMMKRGTLDVVRDSQRCRVRRADAFRILHLPDPEGSAPILPVPVTRPASRRAAALLRTLS